MFSLNSGYTVSEACAKLSSGTNRCTGTDDTTGTPTTDTLSILFKRPNPDAFFATDIGGESYVSGYVQVKSADGTKRSILIISSGQISVQAPGTLP